MPPRKVIRQPDRGVLSCKCRFSGGAVKCLPSGDGRCRDAPGPRAPTLPASSNGRIMRILLPTHQLAAAGIGTFIDGLSTSLSAALHPDDELLLVGERPEGLDGANVRCLQSPALARARLGRLAFEQVGIGRVTRAVDVVHLPNPHALLLNSAPFVVTVHDVFFLDRPEWYPR